MIDEHYVSRLLIADGACFGALAFDLHDGSRTAFVADAVVLCGGGHTRIWRRSSSRRDENFGEAMALALQGRMQLMDMELVQFHPTGMVAPEEAAGVLVTEAVRGEGGHLYNVDGERFMARYDPERMELSTRDRVALANYTEIAEGRGGPHGGVFLDITHAGKDVIVTKLPRMYRQFIEYQMLDISREPMEVAPTAHYSMGGIVVEPETHATDVVGLYAAGECTAGLHGANRLGGNSLTETIVYGKRAGRSCRRVLGRLRHRDPSPPRSSTRPDEELDAMVGPGSELARPLQRALRDVDVGALRRHPRRATASATGSPSSTRSARSSPTSTCGRAPKAGPTSPSSSTSEPGCSSPRPPCGARSPVASRAAATTGPTSPTSTRPSRSTSTLASVTTDDSSSRGASRSRRFPTSSCRGSTRPAPPACRPPPRMKPLSMCHRARRRRASPR